MPVSISDIARRAGVSPSTVSRALNDHPRISEATKKNIQQLAKSMGYIPSQIARSLVARRSTTIGVAVHEFPDPFIVSLISSIEDVVLPNEHDLYISSFYRDSQLERRLYQSFIEKRVAGIIVIGSLIDEEYLELSVSSIPVVLVNCLTYPFSVSTNQYSGAIMAMDHLLGLGHRRIAYISQGTDTNTDKMRFKGYCFALNGHNIPQCEDFILSGDGSSIGGIKAVSQLLQFDERPTGIFCYNDLTAIGVMNALQQNGFRVPQDFSVVGFDDLDIAAYYYPSLTTIRQPIYQLGQEAANMLFGLTEGSDHVKSQVLEPQLIVRDTTGPSCEV